MARRLLIIEDHVTFTELIKKELRNRQVSGPAVEVRSHLGLLDDWPHPHEFDQFSMVLVDAYAGEPQQRDHRESIFVGLEVLERLQRIADERGRRERSTTMCPVTVYSTNMGDPAVNIPAREYGIVRACIETDQLISNVVRLLTGEKVSASALVPGPVAADYRELGVGPAARVAEAYHRMRERPDAWELVWRPDFDTSSRSGFAPEPKVREFINDTVRPLLDIEVKHYKPVVEVMRKVAGLPR